MPLTLLPCTPADIPTLIHIYNSSFQDPLSHAGFPRTPTVHRWWSANLLEELNAEPLSRFLKVIDTDTADEEIIAFGKWNLPSTSGNTLDAEMPPWPEDEGSDHALLNEFFGSLAKKRAEIMSTRPHYYLEMLGTLPEHQGRGAGSLMMKWGVELADREGMDAYLESSPKGVGVYRRFGFVEQDEVTVNVEAYGEYKNLCMVRKPTTGAQHNSAPEKIVTVS